MLQVVLDLAKQTGSVTVSDDPNSPPSWWAAGHEQRWEHFAALLAEHCAGLAETSTTRDEAACKIRGQFATRKTR